MYYVHNICTLNVVQYVLYVRRTIYGVYYEMRKWYRIFDDVNRTFSKSLIPYHRRLPSAGFCQWVEKLFFPLSLFHLSRYTHYEFIRCRYALRLGSCQTPTRLPSLVHLPHPGWYSIVTAYLTYRIRYIVYVKLYLRACCSVSLYIKIYVRSDIEPFEICKPYIYIYLYYLLHHHLCQRCTLYNVHCTLYRTYGTTPYNVPRIKKRIIYSTPSPLDYTHSIHLRS